MKLLVCALALGMVAPLAANAGDPDLTVHLLKITPEAPKVGNSVEIKATLKNIGTGSVGDFLCIGGDIPVHFFVNDELVAEEQLSCGLDPDETDNESASFIVYTADLHTVSVVIDPDNTIEELDESNNEATLQFTAAEPEVEVTHTLPAVGAPGLKDAIATVKVTNGTEAKIKDVYVFLELEGKIPLLDFGNTQGADLSPGETQAWEAEVSYGLDVSFGALEPGKYTWRYQVFQHALPPSPDALPLTEVLFAPLNVVPTVEVTEDNIVVPNVDPVAVSQGPVSTITAHDVLIDGELYVVSLGFAEPVEFLEDSSWTVMSRVHALLVKDAMGMPVCDPELRQKAAQAVLLWRDLVVEHPWYKGSYVALQESFDWYQNEKHLKVVFYITQPFVIVKELLQDMLTLGSGLTDWAKQKMGFTTPEEAEVGTLTFKVTMVITKGFDTAGTATQALVKLSPLLAGEAYLSDHVIAERLLQAIENGGDDMDAAVNLVHELIKEDSPDRYEKITQAVPVGVIIGSIASTLADGVKQILWTGVKKGFTAYFISKLTAKTAWKVAVGEGSATLMAGLTTAGVAKGLASLGLTLIIDVSIAYLTYVGTFVDNIRGPGGLIEAGQIVAQSIPWTHVLYTPDGGGGSLDADSVDDTFLAHAVLFEVYGFILSDLAMLKKLAFAKKQSADYLDDSLKMFEVSKAQRTFIVSLQTTASMLANGACEGSGEPRTNEAPVLVHEPAPEPGGTPDEPPQRIEPEDERGWTKPRAVPARGEEGTHPPVRWTDHDGAPVGAPEAPPAPPALTVETSACSTSGRPGGSAPVVLLMGLLGLLFLSRKEARF